MEPNRRFRSAPAQSWSWSAVQRTARFSTIETDTQRTPVLPLECPVRYEDVSRAYYRIKSGIVRTPCNYSMFLSELCETDVYTKLDFQQASGSFKERGARNALMLLAPEAREKGVIAASAGNHALALAWHGKKLNIPVTCVMPLVAPLTKVEKCRKFGANVILEGSHIGEARDFAKKNFPDLPYM